MPEGGRRPAAPARSRPHLAATLMPPPVPIDALARPRLEALLDQALECGLTVLTAPPGSGKTVLVAQWVNSRPDMVACWLSVSAGDHDPARFWHHVLSAVERAAPQVTRSALKRLRDESGTGFAAETLIVFLNDLAELDHDLVIVIDDLHELTEASTVESLA